MSVLLERKSIPYIGKIDWKLAFILCLPLLLHALNQSMLFFVSLKQMIDPWIYFGYFLDLKTHLNAFPGTYYGTRLPWILPGFLAYKFLPASLATWVLHFTFLYASIISLYIIVKKTISDRAALISASLMTGYYWFFQAIADNNVDGAGIAYFLLTLLMLTSQKSARFSQLKFFFAGVFCACMIYTQLFLIIMTPFVLSYYLFVNRSIKIRQVFLFLVGFSCLTIFLCTINYILCRDFWFFMHSVRWLHSFVSSGPNPWWVPLSKDLTWLLLPAVILYGSLTSLRSPANSSYARFFQIFYISSCILFLIIQYICKQPALSLYYYTSYLYPAMFLALSAQIEKILGSHDLFKFWPFFILTLILSIWVYLFPICPQTIYNNSLSIAQLCGLLGGTTFFFIRRQFIGKIGLICISIAFGMDNAHAIFNINSLNGYKSSNPMCKDAYLAIIDSVKAVREMDPQAQTKFWYNSDQATISIYRAVCSTYLWGYRIINENFPNLASTTFPATPKLAPSDSIFILSDKDAINAANHSLAKVGFQGNLVAEKTIHRGSFQFKVSQIRLSEIVQSKL